MILGLTGGIGCGKSTAAAFFESRGFRRLDSDAIIRTRLLTAPDIVSAIAEHFGHHLLSADGQVQRAALAAIIFADDDARTWLESLLHPRLLAHWRAALAEAAEDPWIVEVPLLFEKGLENWFDFTLCVSTTASVQLSRLERRGLTRALATQRISKQLPLARKIELADFVLSNDGAISFLQAQVVHLTDTLIARR